MGALVPTADGAARERECVDRLVSGVTGKPATLPAGRKGRSRSRRTRSGKLQRILQNTARYTTARNLGEGSKYRQDKQLQLGSPSGTTSALYGGGCKSDRARRW